MKEKGSMKLAPPLLNSSNLGSEKKFPCKLKVGYLHFLLSFQLNPRLNWEADTNKRFELMEKATNNQLKCLLEAPLIKTSSSGNFSSVLKLK